jgi:sorbitol/mannitol transport system permease protein
MPAKRPASAATTTLAATRPRINPIRLLQAPSVLILLAWMIVPLAMTI